MLSDSKKPQFTVVEVSKKSPKPRCQLVLGINWFRRFLLLLGFHTLNFLVGVAGFISAAMMLLSAAMWLSRSLCSRVFNYVGETASEWADLVWILIAMAVLMAVGVICVECAIGAALCYPSVLAMTTLLKADFRVAKLVKGTDLTLEIDTIHQAHRPNEFGWGYTLQEPFDTPPRSILNAKGWKLVMYFAVVKVVVGVLSVVVVFLVVVQPVLAVCTSGNDPLLSKWTSYDDKPEAYIATNVILWAIGLVAMIGMAKLSVHLTCSVGRKLGSVSEASEDIETAILLPSLKASLL